MARILEYGIARPELDDLPRVHDRDTRSELTHNCEIVSDEEESQVKLVLDVLEEVDDLSLNGDVERARTIEMACAS